MYLNQVYFGHGNYGVEAASTWLLRPPREGADAPRGGAPRGPHPAARGLLADPQPVGREGPARLRPAPDGRGGLHRPTPPRPRRRETPVVVSRSAREATVGPYFCEEVRQYLEKTYGDRGLYRQGLRVDSTLDPRLQGWAEDALRWGLRRHERRFGFRKPRNLVDEGVDPEKYRDPVVGGAGGPGRRTAHGAAVVLSATRTGAELRVERRAGSPSRRRPSASRAPRAPRRPSGAATSSWSRRSQDEDGKAETVVSQEPVVEGAVVVLENGTGAVRALVGGYDFSRSKFNRAVQALRQVGLRLQAGRLHDRDRGRLHARRHRPRLADLDHDRPEAGPLAAPELHPQVRRHPHLPVRPRALDQRPGGPGRPPRRDAEGRSRRPAGSASARTLLAYPRSRSAPSR